MTILHSARRLLPALTIACTLGAAPLAMAQTSTMAPMAPSTMAPASKTVKFDKRLEFKTEAAATAHCPGDTVVWASLTKSHAYHLSGTPHYGKTKHGAYVCKKDADAAGLKPSKM